MTTTQQTPSKPSLADPAVVRELFDLAAQEIMFRLVKVSAGGMTSERARDMDDALARHLARALMGENPEFLHVVGWHGAPCAKALAEVDPAFYDTVWAGEAADNHDNPLERMVRATTVFYRAVYEAIKTSVVKPDATQQSVRAAVSEVVDKYALAAMPAAGA